MRLASPWTPRLSDSAMRPAERLARALEDDINAGLLPAGARLPAHRDLAYRLGIGLGSVTKAYQQLEALGLVTSVQGRGMFVRHSDLSLRPPLDLSLNAPPQMLSDQFLAMSLGKLARRLDASSFGAYVPPAGRADHRAAKAEWLCGLGIPATGARTLLCSGAQQALAVAIDLMDAADVQMLLEPITYPGILDLCRRRSIAPRAIAGDADGILPEALERQLHALKAEGRRGGVYLMPTIHNPTTSTLPADRRDAIVRLCRAYDAWIVEDDVYAPLADEGLPALAQLAPERVFYVGSLSKIVSPGLRMGWLVVPPAFAAAAEAILASSTTTAAPLSCFLLVTWLADRAVESLMGALKQEAAARRALAIRVFADALPEARIAGFHLWLPRPLAEAERLAADAQARGLLLLPPRSFALPDTEAAGVRLCLGPPPHADLERALRLFKRLATTPGGQRALV